MSVMEVDTQQSSSSSAVQPRDVIGGLIMTVSDDDGDDEENDDVIELPSTKPDSDTCGPSPAKSRKVETDVDGVDEDGYICIICYCPFTNSGEHRLSCLACGHLFGKSCIEKWLRTTASCPQCNIRSKKRDIRILYTKNLQALDTAEKDRALQDLEQAKNVKQKAELEIATLKISYQAKDEEIKKLKQDIETQKVYIAKLEAFVHSSSLSNSSSHTKAAMETLKAFPGSRFFSGEASSSTAGGSREVLFTPWRAHDWKGEECRVATFSEWSNAFVVSHKFKALSTSGLSKSLGCYGVRIFNWVDPSKALNMPSHQKEIRDMMFSPRQNDLLLTVGMDSKANLTNIHSALQVMSIATELPLWSCAFNLVDDNIFYAGTANGQVLSYDIRKPKELLGSLNFPSQDKLAVCRLHFVPPSYQGSGFNACGLLVQKLSSCWFVEFQSEGEVKYHQLPFEGGFSSLDFEPASRHVLVSAKPSTKHPTARHMVCEMVKGQSFDGSNAYSCNIVNTFPGGGLGKLYRPKIFSPKDGKVYVTSSVSNSAVHLWDLSDSELKQTFPTKDTVVDCVTARHNDSYYLNFLTNDRLETYKFQ